MDSKITGAKIYKHSHRFIRDCKYTVFSHNLWELYRAPLKLLLSHAPKISLLCSNYVPLCPKHASTIVQLNALLEYFIDLFHECGDCSIRVHLKLAYYAGIMFKLHPSYYAKNYAGIMCTGLSDIFSIFTTVQKVC